MAKSLTAPTRYFQGSALLSNVYQYVSHIGRRFVIITDKRVRTLIEAHIRKGFQNAGHQCVFLEFNGETTLKEIWRLSELAVEENCSGIMGAGGGKAVDAAKLVGDICGLPVVSVPTSASNDAACSCMASIYTEDGSFLKIQRLKAGPEVILADTGIIARAPTKLLISGMGEAFATYYETRACERSGIQNYTGGVRTHTSLSLAKLCKELLLKYGEQAIKDVERKRDSQAVEAIIEANIYISGVGYENNGCAASQAIYNGMTIAIKPFKAMHGEGIAFGVLVQLIMEYNEAGRWNQKEWDQTIEFYRTVGLPRRFEHLQMSHVDDRLLKDIAKASCDKGSNIHNMPFEVTENKVYNALKQINDMELD